jgi:hypothetical protein
LHQRGDGIAVFGFVIDFDTESGKLGDIAFLNFGNDVLPFCGGYHSPHITPPIAMRGVGARWDAPIVVVLQ